MPGTDFIIADEELAFHGGPEQQKRVRPFGCFQVGICLLLVELCEKFAFFEVVCNMIPFCTVKLGYYNHQAAILNLCFIGASVLTPLFVGWLADNSFGRNTLVCISLLLHFLGTALLSVLAFPLEDFYGGSYPVVNNVPVEERAGLFHIALLTLCLGTGGIRAVVRPLDAYGLQEHESKKPMSFFSWASWSMNLSAAAVFLGISCIQHSGAGAIVVLLPSLSVFTALVALYMRRCDLLYQPEKHCSLLTVSGVIVKALKKCCLPYCLLGREGTSWSDHAMEKRGGRHNELQEEDTEIIFSTLLPLFSFQLVHKMCLMQIPSGYYLQTMNSNRNLEGSPLPIALMNAISILPLLILAPFMDYCSNHLLSSERDGPLLSAYIRVAVSCVFPVFLKPMSMILPIRAQGVWFWLEIKVTKIIIVTMVIHTEIFSTQVSRIYFSPVAGNGCAALSVAIAGFLEIHRKLAQEQSPPGKGFSVSSLAYGSLVPQYVLLGVSEALVNPAVSMVIHRFIPSTFRGTSMNFLTLFHGFACFSGALLVELVYLISEGNWFPNTLNKGNLEGFFFVLASLTLLNVLGFWRALRRYCNLNHFNAQSISGRNREETLLYKKSLKFYGSIHETSSSIDLWETAL